MVINMVNYRYYRRISAAPAVACLFLLGMGACAHQSAPADVASSAPRVAPSDYYVFFERWSANLGTDAQTVIAHAAQDAAQARPQHVRIVGYADPVGDKAANEVLAQARAQRVATALIANGVPAYAVKVVPHGEIADVATMQGDRRVRIVFE